MFLNCLFCLINITPVWLSLYKLICSSVSSFFFCFLCIYIPTLSIFLFDMYIFLLCLYIYLFILFVYVFFSVCNVHIFRHFFILNLLIYLFLCVYIFFSFLSFFFIVTARSSLRHTRASCVYFSNCSLGITHVSLHNATLSRFCSPRTPLYWH